jgi:hypothetical protein
MMEAARTSETLINFYQTTLRCNPEDSHLHTHRRENLISYCCFAYCLNLFNFYRYLQEIGYTDTIIDVRSNRVRLLLGLNNNAESEENLNNAPVVAALNGNESSNKRVCENQGRRTPKRV